MDNFQKQQIVNQGNSLLNIDNIDNEYDLKVKDLKECPNCKSKIKTGVFGSNIMFDKLFVDFVNMFNKETHEYYCTSCGEDKLSVARKKLSDKNFALGCKVQNVINYVPVITIQNPVNWDYEIVDMVTAQNTTGTGVFFELSTTIDDLLGNKSDKYNSKAKEGENICKNMLRANALRIGANAVIGVDIDYTEVGGGKALFMICMAGTAVKIKNIEILGDKVVKAFTEYDNARIELEKLRKISNLVSK